MSIASPGIIYEEEKEEKEEKETVNSIKKEEEEEEEEEESLSLSLSLSLSTHQCDLPSHTNERLYHVACVQQKMQHI